jgi:MFS-type transporter involved in bile tolerance (Atg22 family)
LKHPTKQTRQHILKNRLLPNSYECAIHKIIMSNKIQPLENSDVIEVDHKNELLEPKDAPIFVKTEDPFFDSDDIVLFNEESIVTLELKDEKRVAKLTKTLFNRSNEGHENISESKVTQENVLLKNRTRKHEVLSWYTFSTAFGLVYAVAIGLFIPIILRQLAVLHACPYKALPLSGTKQACNFFMVDSTLLGKTFDNISKFEQYSNMSGYQSLYSVHGSTIEAFLNLNNKDYFSEVTTTSAPSTPTTIKYNASEASNVTTMEELTYISKLQQLEIFLEKFKQENPIQNPMESLTEDMCIKMIHHDKTNLTNVTNFTLVPHNVTHPSKAGANTSNVTFALLFAPKCFACIRPNPFLGVSSNGTRNIVSVFDSAYIYMQNLTDTVLRSMLSNFFPVLTFSDGYKYTKYDGHVNDSTTCKINPNLNWSELQEMYGINYSYWMQWANFSDIVVRQNYGLINYTCDDSAKKVNATYALTVQQNTTMNSTVYDTAEHASIDLTFVIYNNSHPCKIALNCTPDAIFSISEPRNFSDTNGLEAWREDNISFPYGLNLSHVDINVSVTTSNSLLVPKENIEITRGRFGMFHMKIKPLPFRIGSTSVSVEIRTKPDRKRNIPNITNTTNSTLANNASIYTKNATVYNYSRLFNYNITNITNNNCSNTTYANLNSSNCLLTYNCSNVTYANLNSSNCSVLNNFIADEEEVKTFDLSLFQRETHGLKYTFTLRVNKTICAHEVQFLMWRVKARDFPQHIFYLSFLTHLIVTVAFGAIGDYCCMRQLGLILSASFASITLMSFTYWKSPNDYACAGFATIATVCGLGLASIFYNTLFTKLVQADKISHEKLTLLSYESDIIPFNSFQQHTVDTMSNYSVFISYIAGSLGLICSLVYIIWEAKSFNYIFPIYLTVNALQPNARIMSNIIFACGLFMGFNTLVIIVFSWCRCGHKCKEMPKWSNILVPVTWPMFSIYKYCQILTRPDERKLVKETGKGLLLLFIGFFCVNTFTYCWKIYLGTEFDFNKDFVFFITLLFSILVQVSCVIWLYCARRCQNVFGVEHIDMFLMATFVFQLVTFYAIFAVFPQIPFGLKVIEEFIPYLVIQSFCKAIFEAYGRTWYMKVIPSGYDSQFFALYQNAVGIGQSWSGSKWADFVFQENGSIMIMNIFIFLFVMIMNCAFCCACLSIKKGRTHARLLRRLIRNRPPRRSWKHLNEQVKNIYLNQNVSHKQMGCLINLTHTTINIVDIIEPFVTKYPKVLKSKVKSKIKEIAVFEERNPSPFFYFQKQVRPRLQARLKNLSQEEITQKIHKLWENLELVECQNFLDEAEKQTGNDRKRFYVKEQILWNYRYTNDLKKLPEFLQPAIKVQKVYRGWITRKRLNGDLKSVRPTCWQSILQKVNSSLNLSRKRQR